MKVKVILKMSLFITLVSLLAGSVALAQAVSPRIADAKQAAENRGYIFEASHDEIVAKAKKESGMIQVLSSLDPDVYGPMIQSFNKKYPFLNAVILEITGTEAAQRFFLEVKSGGGQEFDIVHPTSGLYDQWPPHGRKFDILGMAEQGVLKIHPKMVDPKHRKIVGLGHALTAVAYNKNLISPEKVPDTWEGFLKPEFKGRKFIVDIRPHVWAVFAACSDEGLGEEWMVNYARKIKEQDPIWVRGHTRTLTAMVAGEYALHSGTNYHSGMRLKEKVPGDILQLKMVEPLPMRLMEPEMVNKASSNPYSALLFLEHEASPEGQAIIDKYEPLKASVYSPNSALAKEAKGKKLCINGFETYHNTPRWMDMALKALGFPKAEIRKR